MKVTPTRIPAVLVLEPKVFEDPRGFFLESYNRRVFKEAAGVDPEFVQDNESFSVRNVLRGLHYQIQQPQGKLVRVVRGAVFDVAVDIRRDSPTYGKHVAVVLSAVEGNQLFVPGGFAHGFCTLEPNTEVLYKVNRYYSPAHDCGLAWDDPALGIAWPMTGEAALLSDKDRRNPVLAELPAYFRYVHP